MKPIFELGGRKISNLWFVDDITLIAVSMNDMNNQI